MTILIGLAPGQKDDAAVHLGGMLARSSAEDVVVVSVVQAPWPLDPCRGDKEYLAYQQNLAEIALSRAREHLGKSVLDADYVVRRAESAPAGLLPVVSERRCSSVVVGSSTMGLLGHVMLGGVAERILHSAELPIVVAPRGFHAGRATTVSQVSAAFGRADQTIANSKPGGGDGGLATRVETALGQGARWSSALHDVAWTDGDLPAVGISSGPLGRLFLGSNAAKIVRSSPVPVMLLSRDPV